MELLKCRFCGAPYAYRENLELHEKGCPKRPVEEEVIAPEVRVEREQKLFPIKLRVDAEAPGKGYTIEMSHKGQVFATHMEPTIKDLEEWLAGGRDELDLYRGLREVGGEYLWLLKFLQNFGFANFPELAEVFVKAEEERWYEITPEMYSTLERAWRDAFKTDWVLTWTPADIEWTDAAKYHRDVFYRKHRYDELMAMRREGVDHIAKIKGISTVGRKTEVAQRIHEYDFGEPVPEWRLV